MEIEKDHRYEIYFKLNSVVKIQNKNKWHSLLALNDHFVSVFLILCCCCCLHSIDPAFCIDTRRSINGMINRNEENKKKMQQTNVINLNFNNENNAVDAVAFGLYCIRSSRLFSFWFGMIERAHARIHSRMKQLYQSFLFC